MDTVKIHPETLAGDPFAAAGNKADRPCACYSGWVFVSFENAEGEEAIEAYPCRRCHDTQALPVSCTSGKEATLGTTSA
jgi:hypothetical protein